MYHLSSHFLNYCNDFIFLMANKTNLTWFLVIASILIASPLAYGNAFADSDDDDHHDKKDKKKHKFCHFHIHKYKIIRHCHKIKHHHHDD